jgi:hypothetical protein
LGFWLSQRLHTGPDAEPSERILGQLARQGWSVRDDRLVISEPMRGEAAAVGMQRDQTSEALKVLERTFRHSARGFEHSAAGSAAAQLLRSTTSMTFRTT